MPDPSTDAGMLRTMLLRTLLVSALLVTIGGFLGGEAARQQDEQPTVFITQPSDLSAATPGDEIQIEWETANLDPKGTFEIWFRTPDGQWNVIEKREPGPGSASWAVPDIGSTGVGRLWVGNLTNPEGETTDEKYEAFDETKLRFLQNGPVPSTRITSPSHGALVNAGEEIQIEWDAANLNPQGTFEIWVRLEGEDWKKLASSDPRPGSLMWSVPQVEQATTAKIWVGNLTDPTEDSTIKRYEIFDEIDVNIVVPTSPLLFVYPHTRTISTVLGESSSDLTSLWVTFSRPTAKVVKWKAETTVSWIELVPQAASQSMRVELRPKPTGLSPGTHTGEIIFRAMREDGSAADGVPGSPTIVEVKLKLAGFEIKPLRSSP